MIVYLARAATRVIALFALPLLALVALAFTAAAVIGRGPAASLARESRLTFAWHRVETFVSRVAPSGHALGIAAAVAAVLVGLVIVIGALAPAREREIHLADGQRTLGIRRRALQNALAALAAQGLETTAVKVRLRARRRRPGGVVKVRLTYATGSDSVQCEEQDAARLRAVAQPFALRTHVRSSVKRVPNREAGR